MKKWYALFLAGVMLICCASCGSPKEEEPPLEPDESKIQSICQLAVMDCYYHNVVKTDQKDAEKHWWGNKDKRYWVEYTGIVTLGIDASRVKVDIDGDEITVTMPKAKVLKYKVDSTSLDDSSYIVDKNSVKITSEDVTDSLTRAQEQLKNKAQTDETLLSMAQNRAKELIESYIKNLAKVDTSENKENTYKIKWVYLTDDETVNH